MRVGFLPVSALFSATAFVLATPVASTPGGPFDMRVACRADFLRLCAHVGSEATRDEIRRCLEAHERELSDGCRVALGEELPSGAGRCREEIEALCGAPADRQVLRDCLERYRGELSEECR